MKILFLHLSDIHFKQDTPFYEINPSALVNSLTDMGSFDECIIIVSGDVAFSGAAEEFKKAGGFLNKIMVGIQKKFSFHKHIHTMIVPGNHDNLVKNMDRKLSDIREFHLSDVDRYFYNDLDELGNFFTFADRNLCFKKNRVFEVRRLQFGNFVIKFNLINTAPFSLVSDANDDKGLHHLPKREFAKFDFDRGENYTISIMHHSPEWFWDDSKRELYKKLYETSDLIFIGHEHLPMSEMKTVNGQYHVDISNGVALYGTDTEHGFNALIMDTDAKSLRGKKFVYDGKAYNSTDTLINNSLQFRGRYKYTPTKDFRAILETDVDELSGEDYLQYFVFPSLEAKEFSKEMRNYRISTEDKFMEYWKEKKVLTIEGSTKSGKTILGKYLCYLLLNDYVPLYLTPDDFAIRDNQRLLSEALFYRYGTSNSLKDYLQLPKEKRILIVDDKDLIKSKRWDTFWAEFRDSFELVVLFTGIKWDVDLKGKTIDELTDNKMFRLEICPFYYEKRKMLIKKICEYTTHREDQDMIEKAQKINEDISNQIELFQLTPSFIFQYVNCYLSFPLGNGADNTNVFNKVYEANITMRLAKVAGEDIVPDIMMALEYIAYYAHFGEIELGEHYPFTREEFELCVSQYNSDYDNNLSYKFAFEKAIEAKIIRETNGEFKLVFCDDNLLAFFVASRLNRLLVEGIGREDLERVLDNICFRPNGDILLFLSYITNNVGILAPVFESIEVLMRGWEELNFDDKNIEFITKLPTPAKAELPTQQEKEHLAKEKDSVEQEIVERHYSEPEDLYTKRDEDINSYRNKIAKGINYLNLVAKILPNFRAVLKGYQKEKIVSALYTYPNKLLYFLLKDFDRSYDEVIDEIMATNPKTKKGVAVTREMAGATLKHEAIILILTVYNFISEISSNSRTITDLNKTEYFNVQSRTNYQIMNLLMEESAGNFQAMATKAERLFKSSSLDIVKSVVPMIVRKYFLCHEIPSRIKTDHVIDVFFGEKEKKALQIVQLQNRSTKK